MSIILQIRNRFFIAGIFFLHGFLLSAQHLTLTLDKDTIGFSETVVLRLTGEAKDISNFAELPQPDGVMVISRTNNYSQIANSNKIKFTQTFTLSPYKVGTFSIGPAWVQSGSNRIFSNKIKLVVKSGNPTSMANEIFMRCEPDKKKVVMGEQIALSIRIYSRVGAWPGEDRPLAKSFNGFWYHEGSTSESYKDSAVLINGLMYVGKTIYKEFVFPNTTGKLKIPAYDYACFVKQNPFPTGDPMVDDIMGIQIPVQLVSPEIPIEVNELPSTNKPKSFMGDVGKFALSASIDKADVKANDAIKLTVTISGTGNINFIQLPKINFPEGIENYPPSSTDTTQISKEGIEGQKTFTVVLIPKKEGSFSIPGITYSYFDPKKKEYVTIETPAFAIHVAPADPSKDVSESNLPQSFLEGKTNGKSILRILLIIVPTLLLLTLFYYQKRKKIKENDLLEVEKSNEEIVDDLIPVQKEKPEILMMISTAESHFINGKTQLGVAQLYETLLAAVLYKTELTREEASIQQIKYRLEIKKTDSEMLIEIVTLLDELNLLRYTSWNPERSNIDEKLTKARFLSTNLCI